MNYRNDLRAFIQNNLTISEDDVSFSDEDNYFELGFVNSLFAMKLVNFVEDQFGIEIENDELDISNFSSINNLSKLIEKKLKKSSV
ncbi:acyl carrier protein [Bacillus horti]|uniref:Acyl carrier protein n=1 Tax=Caldalkalibacillus horti TaxID=77523 RepID=A0ABT9VUT2_9BACI|nr:acyl carrier protein [Bacillus horti]MDQ0164753.1 acyl carrier protein [Bacillus horti]